MTNHASIRYDASEFPELPTSELVEFEAVTIQIVRYRGLVWTYTATDRVEEVLITPDGRQIDAYFGTGEPHGLEGDDLAVWQYVQAYNC